MSGPRDNSTATVSAAEAFERGRVGDWWEDERIADEPDLGAEDPFWDHGDCA